MGPKVPRENTGTAWPYKLARRFAQHLLDIGVTQPAALTEVQQARATLLRDRLPITVEIGDALSRYLREERGPATCRMLFVTHRAPHRPFKDGQIANTILKDALKATGQKPAAPYVGSHLLRHSLATQLVNTGASLDEVGDVLRHRSRSSTMIYARLDIDGLRSVAQPWPVVGGAQ